jgi:hypothetical protein
VKPLNREEGFSLKAFAISNGECFQMWEVTPEAIEHGEQVTDTRTGRHGQVRCTAWIPELTTWAYCISMKDIDDEKKWVLERFLIRAPAQTRIDEAGTKVFYAPRRLKHQQHLAAYVQRRNVNIKDPYNNAAWRTKRLDKLT